jgi:glycosyltransferase involved in cell wall biosynthesis
MKFSLVIATVGRVVELERLLRSLRGQTHRDFEAIVVDQNSDDRLVPTIAAAGFPVRHVVSERGLSRARNVGIRHVSGDAIAFPDDDCWYGPDTLARVAGFFERRPEVSLLAGMARDADGHPSQLRWPVEAVDLDRFNVWRRAISFTVFVKSEVVRSVGRFDELVGVGAGTPWGSGEETDYLLRALDAGFRGHYDPSVVVFHPPALKNSIGAEDKAYRYGCGYGRLLRKHRMPWWFRAVALGRPVAGLGLAVPRRDGAEARYFWGMFRGRLRGLFDSSP